MSATDYVLAVTRQTPLGPLVQAQVNGKAETTRVNFAIGRAAADTTLIQLHHIIYDQPLSPYTSVLLPCPVELGFLKVKNGRAKSLWV